MGSLELRTEHRQTQALSPRLQRAVRLLQLSSLDFSAIVREQLGSNPFLETEDADDDGALDAADSGFDQEAPPDGAPDDAQQASETPLDGMLLDDREFWNADTPGSRSQGSDGGEDGLAGMELMAQPTSLHEHLLQQLQLLRLPERDLLLAGILVESLDDDGYLRCELDELAEIAELEPPVEADEMLIALRRVQALDPAGVGARTVGECLQLQLPAIECEATRALAARIITEQLPRLAARDMNGLAQALAITPAQAEAVCLRLRRLDPRPGWRYGNSRVDYVVPDVLARKVRGQWTVQLNPAVVPRVRLNKVYAELFQRHRRQDNAELATHLQEARWTLRNVEQRFATIVDVAAAIVRRQRHFLEFGAMAMRPLGLKEIADEVGMHESTVSRVTNNKYIATPSGVYELKFFFSRVMLSSNGSACSATAIRGLIKDIIEAESPLRPLSDADIMRELAQQGLPVARRTVTKYRQMLHIEPVERRRQQQA